MRLLATLVVALLMAGCAADTPSATPDDTDGDGFTDADELAAGTDPADPASHPMPERVSQTVSFQDGGLIVLGAEDPTGAGCGQVSPMGTLSFTWSIVAPINATAARVQGMTVTATYPPTMPEGDIYVFAPDGTQLTDSTPVALPPDPQGTTDTVTVEGEHPPGDYRIEVRGCVGAGQIAVSGSATLSFVPDPEDRM